MYVKFMSLKNHIFEKSWIQKIIICSKGYLLNETGNLIGILDVGPISHIEKQIFHIPHSHIISI